MIISRQKILHSKPTSQSIGFEKSLRNIPVFEFSRGTNNYANSYHSRLKAIVCRHRPNIYTFLPHLNILINDTTEDGERVEAGLNIICQKKEIFVRNTKFKRTIAEWNITLTVYINAIAYTFDGSLSIF